MTIEERLNWIYWDAQYEGTNNFILRIYYRFRMRLIEWQANENPK
jgi:hypothetical protein